MKTRDLRLRQARTAAVVRAPLWWTPKVLPVVAAAALGALVADVEPRSGLVRMVAMVVSAAGMAAFAHVVNDLADIDVDRAAGKRNVMSGSSTLARSALLVLSGAVTVIPWLFVGAGTPALAVLGVLAAASIAYSLPPLRLKEHGGIGVIADAAVAHLLPTLFALMLMASAGERTGLWWSAVAFASLWSFGFGIRNIIVHQILDADGDERAAVATYVVRRGVPNAARSARDAFAVEVFGLAGLALTTTLTAWGTALFFAAHLGLWLNHRRWDHTPIDSVPTSHDQWLPLAEFYEVWPAVVLGFALATRDLEWLWLPVAVAVAFWPAVEKQLLDQIAMLAELGAWLLNTLLPVLERLGIRTGMTARSAGGLLVTGGWALRSALNRCYHRVRIALRETGFSIARAWWSVYRAIWRFRHRFDPATAFVRRQRRRARRILRGGPRRTRM